jgi:hypothetical protein
MCHHLPPPLLGHLDSCQLAKKKKPTCESPIAIDSHPTHSDDRGPTCDHKDEQTLTLSGVGPGPANSHARSPSDPNYLAPSPILAHPHSGTSSTEDPPPSSTLSAASSVYFQTSVDLRGRSPGDGTSSLQAVQQHARKNSAVSFQTAIEADRAGHGVPPSSTTSSIAAPATAAPTEESSTDKK